MKWKRIAILIPSVLGILANIFLTLGVFENPVFFFKKEPSVYFRVDLGTLFLFIGLSLTILLGAGAALADWSQRIENQGQARAAAERRRFLRRLDHELKNPLTAIRAGLANLAEAQSPETRQDALESVETQALRLSRLSTDLRKLAELETRPLERDHVDIANLLQEAFTIAQDNAGAEERHLTLTIPQAPWPLPKILGDQDLLFLAIHNLLDNALKFTNPGNTIEVRAYEDGSYVVLEFADTGPGIRKDEVPHVWEELYRGKGARGVSGSGIGLALVRAIADRHGGHVSLRSRAGQGTVFSLRLPIG